MKWTGKITALAVAGVLLLQPVAASALTYSSWYSPYRYSSYNNYSYTAPRTTATASTTSSTATSSVEQTLLTLLNQERTKRGLAPLQSHSTLTNLARLKSQDMVTKNYFSHTSPTYGTPAQMLARYGVSYTSFAENIAKGSDAYRIHAMWMASAGHRANILNARFTHVGLGVASTGTGGYAATQLFISR